MNNQTLIIIMSAGRCGSTSTINFLNQFSFFNIYGENYGFILNLLSSISNINQLINKNQSKKTDSYEKYNIEKKYCKNGFYHNNKKSLIDIKDSLCDQVKNFFNDKETPYIGFKEIRWIEHPIKNLLLLESFYHNVLYIYLKRNITDQTNSFKRTWMQNKSELDISNYISKTNKTIEKFLHNKQNNSLSINISEDDNFLEKIKNFIVAKNSVIDTEWNKIFE